MYAKSTTSINLTLNAVLGEGKMGERTLGFFSPFLSLSGASLRAFFSPEPPYPVSFFSVYKDSHSKVVVLREVTEVSALLAQRSVIYVLKKNLTVLHHGEGTCL